MLRLGIRSPQLGFCIIINSVKSSAKPFYDFLLNMESAQNATIRSSIGAPEIVKYDVKHYFETGEILRIC